MGCRQCLPLSVVQLKGKPHCHNGVVDTFGLSPQVQIPLFIVLFLQQDNAKLSKLLFKVNWKHYLAPSIGVDNLVHVIF